VTDLWIFCLSNDGIVFVTNIGSYFFESKILWMYPIFYLISRLITVNLNYIIILMIKFYLVLCLQIGLFSHSFGQVFTDSNLPIIIINTDNGTYIPDDPRVFAHMKIIYQGEGIRNYISDQNDPAKLNYFGRISIETRGSSSQELPKKPYGFSTKTADITANENVSLLGMPEEHDWILNSLDFDPSLIRDYICYNFSRQIGNYASRTAFCEVVVNGNYRGLYFLGEKIKSDKNRVDITEISSNDNAMPDLSGGYITKADKNTGGDPFAFDIDWVHYIHHEPKPEDITDEQNNYIYEMFTRLKSTTAVNNSSFANGYPSIIDVPSFIDFILINELSANVDAYSLSTFFHKDRNGKLRAGPIWDLNLTFGNDLFLWGYDRSKSNVWQFSDGGNDGSLFWRNLFSNPQFKCYLSKRWYELTQPGFPLNQESIFSFIDDTVSMIDEAIDREESRWGMVGDHALEISTMKLFIRDRIKWMNEHIGSYSACSNVFTPPLVINEIMYHPDHSNDLNDTDNHEFIEILNNGNQTVDLTGVYFSGTGLVYQFPANSKIAPNTSIKLASDADTFKAQYGYAPFGQYTRHLSDKSQDIVLADGFGNEIDRVQYFDSLPWPDADGNGLFLKLMDPNSDNSLPENWTAISGIVAVNEIESGGGLTLYPNPVVSELNVKSVHQISRVQLLDLNGRLIQNTEFNSDAGLLDMSNIPPGFYIIKVITSSDTYNRKIVKE